MKFSRWAFIGMWTLASATVSFADVPRLLNHQGRLMEGDKPISTPTLVTFAIWDAGVGGDSLWSEIQLITPDTNGLFSVLLGSVVPVADSALDVPAAYLAVRVDGSAEMTPRVRLASVPYALRSDATSETESPRIVSAAGQPSVYLGQGDSLFETVASVPITIPAPGSIYVQARATAQFTGTTGWNYAQLQIADFSGGGPDLFNMILVGSLSAPSEFDHSAIPVYVDRMYQKPAGTYTFRLKANADESNNADAETSLTNTFITVIYFPDN